MSDTPVPLSYYCLEILAGRLLGDHLNQKRVEDDELHFHVSDLFLALYVPSTKSCEGLYSNAGTSNERVCVNRNTAVRTTLKNSDHTNNLKILFCCSSLLPDNGKPLLAELNTPVRCGPV